MKQATKLNIQAAVFSVVLLALIVGFWFTVNVGMDEWSNKSVTSYYLSSDNVQELKYVHNPFTKTDNFTVNGQEVSLSVDNGVATPPRTWQGAWEDSPMLLISFLLLVMLLGVAFVIPSQVQGRMMYYYRGAILRLIYKRAKGGKVNLPVAPAGIIAVRRWGLTRKGVLVSLNQGKRWESLVLEDKIPPVVHSTAGIYAYRLGSDHAKSYNGITQVMGIVVMTGRVISHFDHTLRGERAKILFLVAKNEKSAMKLRHRYQIPVVANTNPALAIETWAMSEQGLFWQTFNNVMIQRKRAEGMADSIESLPAYKEFGGKK